MNGEIMSSKIFYTCPIKAEFMSKYHDMKFTNETGQEIIPFFYRNLEKFYIHPESNPLLELRLGDVLRAIEPHQRSYEKILMRNNIVFFQPEEE
jgi:hypothetical protein